MDRLVIYTCITGGYDTLLQPAAPPDWCDFVCLVPEGDRPEGKDGVWTVRRFDCGADSPAAASRYPKMHPHEFFPEYEYSLWTDGNVGIADAAFYDLLRPLMERKVLYAGVRHPLRDCAYDEAYACLSGGKSSLRPMLASVNLLAASGLPRHAGLLENNVIFRSHRDPSVISLDERWWKLYYGCSRRDQMFLSLCLRDAGITPELIFPDGECARTSPLLQCISHDRPEDGRFWPKKWRGLKRALSRLLLGLRLEFVR